MSQPCYLVLLETSGNQNYIFATNKLRENVGASQLTFQAGTTNILNAVHQAGGPDLGPGFPDSLLDKKRNPPLTPASPYPVEVILAVSGKGILLVRDAKTGRKIVSAVTRRALEEAPGLDVRGVVGAEFDWDKDPIHERIREAHRLLEQLRSRVLGPAARFQRLPIVAECGTSGLPAARYDTSHPKVPEHGPRSRLSIAKQEATQAGLERIRRVIRGRGQLPRSTTELEDLGCDWLAVVHADGNGLGQVFLAFNRHAADNRDYIDKLRRFSLALDRCTEEAFCSALSVLRPRGRRNVLPIVPLVLGGDDLTIVCDGRQAMKFVKKFIDEFEQQTQDQEGVKEVLPGGVTCCAGVAIVKPHFPFHAAYELAEDLLKSAKKLAKDPQKRGNSLSAVDFHVLYDASGPDLERIRDQLSVDDGKTILVARPYVTTEGQGPDGRRWEDLTRRIQAVRARDEEGRRRLPNSMLHDLREGLFFGHDEAEARLGLVRNRYRNGTNNDEQPDIDWLLRAGKLFWAEPALTDGPERVLYRTGLLDALDLAEFWEGQA
jgi:hypothetical protein